MAKVVNNKKGLMMVSNPFNVQKVQCLVLRQANAYQKAHSHYSHKSNQQVKMMISLSNVQRVPYLYKVQDA